ncbi:MAG: hypothetical protein KDB68_14760 [Planctomycetes bacterium]|nr:hypothetical protein [Planctomycetota bacterium]
MIDRSLMYLAARQSIGGLKYRLSRLKNPRYLVPAVLAIAYFWMSFGFAGLRSSERPPADVAPLLRLFVGPGLGLLFAMTWGFSPGRPAPAFSRAEAGQLFMLPVSRRALITYRLLRPQLSFLLVAGLAALGASRSADVNPLFAAGGAYVVVNLLSLNAMAASLLCNRMKRRGVPSILQAWPGLLIAAWVVVPLALNWRSFERGSEPIYAWLRERMTGGMAATVHWPLKQLGNIVGATDLSTFGIGVLSGVVACTALFALCMLIVAPFEEEALKIAEAGGRKLDAMKRGGGAAGLRLSRLKNARSTRFPLSPTGKLWRGVFWQTLVGEWRVGTWKIASVVAAVVLGFSFFIDNLGSNTGVALMAMSLSGLFAAMLVLMSPRLMVTGLHTELRFLPVLKALPMRGAELLRGKVRAGALLTSLPAFLFIAAMSQAAYHFSTSIRDASVSQLQPILGGMVLGAITGIPTLAMLMISLESSAVLLFPAWLASAQSEPGFETIGRNLLSFLVRAIAGSIMLIIPALFFGAGLGGGVALDHLTLGIAAGSWLASIVLLAEIELLMHLMGKRFDNMDASPESA